MLYHKNGFIKLSGTYIQVIDTISTASEDLLSGEITFSDKIVDNSPRKNGTWFNYDTRGRIIKIEKFSSSFKPYYSETFSFEESPYLVIQKTLNSDTAVNLEFSKESILLRKYETVGDSLCGSFLEYYPKGKLKLKGNYILVLSSKLVTVAEEDLLTGNISYYDVPEGLIPQKIGIWVEYNEKGEVIKSTTF